MSRSTDSRRAARRAAPRAIRCGPAQAMLFAAALVCAAVTSAGAQTIRIGVAKPRGFYPTGVFGRLQLPIPLGAVNHLYGGGELYEARHEGVTSTTFSAYLVLRDEPLPKAIVSPYVEAGFGAHAIRSRI